jgi:hypothetical protein
MAKGKFGLSGTLNKNKTEEMALPEKVDLAKSTKNVEAVKEKVEALHESEIKPVSRAATEIVTDTKETQKKPPIALKKGNKNNERVIRITVDTPKEIHTKLKIRAMETETTLRDYIVDLIRKDLGIK